MYVCVYAYMFVFPKLGPPLLVFIVLSFGYSLFFEACDLASSSGLVSYYCVEGILCYSRPGAGGSIFFSYCASSGMADP